MVIFDDISKAYTHFYSKEKDGMRRARKCYQCYYCNKFFNQEMRQKRDIEDQNLISYQDNFHAKDDVSFVIYFEFETTAPADTCLDPEQKKMFVLSYVMIVAFHADLILDSIIIQRSFAHSIEQLTSLDYFTRERITFIDHSLIKILKVMAFEVVKRQ